jgi:hypothetical protein
MLPTERVCRPECDRGPSLRAICYSLSDTFALKLKILEAMMLQSLHRARSVGA